MIIYEDESLVIPVGLGSNSSDISEKLQEKEVTITENSTTQITPDSDYIGLSKVTVTTDIPTEVHNQHKYEVVHAKTTTTVYPDSGYTGLSSVIVTGIADLQNKFAKITQGGVSTITYDEGFDGLNEVEIFVDVPLGSIELDSSTNPQRIVTDSSGYCDITVKPYSVKDIYIDSSTVAQTITPTDTDAFKNIYVNPISLRPLEITPSKSMQVFQGAYDFVQAYPVTSSIDSNIVPENIRKDTKILGVTGTLEAIGEREELTVDASTSTQIYTPHQGYVGFSKVTVNGYTDTYAPLFEAGNDYMNLSAANLRGLVNIAIGAFSVSSRAGRIKFNNITFPSTVESLSSYPFIGANYGILDFYDASIRNWPGEYDYMATAYPQFMDSTISSIVFPRKMMGFLRRSNYVIDNCTIDSINLNSCQNLYNIDMLVTDSTVKTITIPGACYEIYRLAKNCSQLTDIYCYATRPPTVTNLVENIATGGTLHVLNGYYQTYMNSDWMNSSNQYSLASYGWTVVADL